MQPAMQPGPPAPAPSLADELKRAQEQVLHERRRADGLALDLQRAKEQYVVLQQSLEQEEEAITNKLIKRLDQLKREKAEMEAEEELLTSTLEKRLEQASKEQALIVGKLQKQLEQLKSEKSKLYDEKIALENHLEAEQEFIMNKLQKQVEKTRQEKVSLAVEKSELARQVSDMAASVEKLKLDKVQLEQEMEMEEENITNRLQRQVDMLLVSFKQVEARLQAKGLTLAELGVTLPALEIPGASSRMARLSSGSCNLSRNSNSSIYGASPAKGPATVSGSFHASGTLQTSASVGAGHPHGGLARGHSPPHSGSIHAGAAAAAAAAAAPAPAANSGASGRPSLPSRVTT